MKCVRDDENESIYQSKGQFSMQDSFQVIVLSSRDINDEDNSQYAENINMENMEIIEIVNK